MKNVAADFRQNTAGIWKRELRIYFEKLTRFDDDFNVTSLLGVVPGGNTPNTGVFHGRNLVPDYDRPVHLGILYPKFSSKCLACTQSKGVGFPIR